MAKAAERAAPGKHGHEPGEIIKVPCCPTLEKCAECETIDFRYRLPFRPNVTVAGRQSAVAVEVTLHFRLERCPGPLTLGDLLYTTTLLPGEQVRLFTSDRHSRFSFDSESKLAYRHETTSEESLFSAGMAQSMSDLSVVENVNKSTSYSESSVSGGGGAGIDLGFVEIGGSVSASSFDASSTSTFARNLSQHAETSSRHVEVAVHAASSTQVGEVAQRTHTEGESEDHFESSSRVFSNPNRCHAIAFYFYRISKCQTIRFTLVRIERRVDDPGAPTGITVNPQPKPTGVAAIPTGILGTSEKRLEAERRARASVQEAEAARQPAALGAGATRLQFRLAQPEPLAAELRKAALAQVDKDLVAEGLIDKVGGEVSEKAQTLFKWERTLVLPTPGVLVKGCLDDCDICEPALQKQIDLELARKALENKLLERQIELLEKSQEYRCCPAGEEEEEED
jgi:hypothetical protein